MPADPEALRDCGTRFLTAAFRASGTLVDSGAIASITAFREVSGGSTGRKVARSVEYGCGAAGLPTELFVKFSRDFDHPIRDRGRFQMEPEVRFAELSRSPEFPITVPVALFGDYERRTGTGILITERIAFGGNGIEPQYHKCLDYEMPEPLEHYRALLRAVARLGGTHRAGRLRADLAAPAVERAPLSREKLERRLSQLAAFASETDLLPAHVAAPEFLARFRRDAHRVARDTDRVLEGLAADSDYVGLCHWNANVDNAWFWRDAEGLHCGLMDWGCAGPMNLGMAVWGAMSGAETDLWERHLDELLGVFVAEFRRCGGPDLQPDRLLRHTVLYAAAMAIEWLLDVPALFRSRFGADVPVSRMDPRIKEDETLRAPLQMLCNVLYLWERHRVGELLDAALADARV
ncbi:hypothetical protein [Mycobacterium sp. Marseille-P9652]|uniref:hypothetical protein n=1 Tax=Mycobacterium sp. Marseille-P9652 TaxID=2654950 RepID=UPI0012E72B2B|nr:hypothetical protein [Mycobacterium sp. Marseille-P9652]